MTERPSAGETSWAERLEDSAEELYENAPCGFVTTTPDGTIVKVNATFLEWTGFAREEIVGRRRFQDLLNAGGRIYHETHYAPLLRMQGWVREIALEIVAADRERVPVLVNAALKTDASGEPRYAHVTVFKATDRREYERELLRARERAERSEATARELARTLQESLMPPALPTVPGVDVGAEYRPAGAGDEIGGDFYDVFEAQPGRWSVVVGDVCGKGAAAARATARARYTIRAAATRTRPPRRVLQALNEAILLDGDDRFCTAVFARLGSGRDGVCQVTFAVGGHPLPILLRPGQEPRAVGRPGQLIGVLPNPRMHDVRVELPPGSAIVFYTDGVVEARAGQEFYDDDRLHRLLGEVRDEDASTIARRVVEDVVGFQEGTARDDVVVLVVKAA